MTEPCVGRRVGRAAAGRRERRHASPAAWRRPATSCRQRRRRPPPRAPPRRLRSDVVLCGAAGASGVAGAPAHGARRQLAERARRQLRRRLRHRAMWWRHQAGECGIKPNLNINLNTITDMYIDYMPSVARLFLPILALSSVTSQFVGKHLAIIYY